MPIYIEYIIIINMVYYLLITFLIHTITNITGSNSGVIQMFAECRPGGKITNWSDPLEEEEVVDENDN